MITLLSMLLLTAIYSIGWVVENFRKLDHRENKAHSLVLRQPFVFITVAINTDGFLDTNVYALFSL